MVKLKDQRGMISLVICMLLMIIISLMTLSFATLSRREQRQALDKQLSTQAFYAAETGINDAIEAIKNDPLFGDVADCSDNQQDKIVTGSDVLDANSNTSRTCVLVDQTPSQLDDIVGESAVTIFPISVSNIDTLDIYWENDSAVSTPVFPPSIDPAGAFPSDTNWDSNTPGVLTIQLIPAAFPTSRAAIASGLIYVFGYPSRPPASAATIGTSSNGRILSGGCATTNTSAPNNWPRQCRVSLDGLSVTGQYYLVLKSNYDPVHVTIEAKDGSGGRLSFTGAQVLIDSTGRANDITKRIKIYKPLMSNVSLPSSVLEIGDDLCKRLLSEPASTTTDSAIPSCDPSTL